MSIQKLCVGDKIRALESQLDEDEHGQERIAPVGMLGEVTSVNCYASQGWTYGIVFDNGCWVFLLDDELNEIALEKETH